MAHTSGVRFMQGDITKYLLAQNKSVEHIQKRQRAVYTDYAINRSTVGHCIQLNM
jgi:hypothetical protein